jgi:5-formyltetrahydrofolate cyclo-ligase
MPNNAEISREKQHIREQVRSRKSTLGTALIPLSEQVTRNLETLPCFPSTKGQSLIYFVGKPQTCEIQSLPHIQALINRGFEVWLPKTIVSTKALRWGKVRDLHSDLVVGAFSVQEPTDAVIARQDIDFSSLQIAIVPGVAFDEHGHRLGYGQGYYDRFLKTFPLSYPVVGLAFEFQVFPEIRTEAHDARVDYLVTEKKIRNFKE